MKKSKLGTIHLNDFWKGLIIAVLAAALSIIYGTVEAGSLDIDWMMVLRNVVIAALAYLSKQLATNSNGQILKKE